MFRWIVTLFVGIPIVELMVLLKVGEWIGFWRTIAIIVMTAVVGASMWRSQGLRIFWKIQEELRHEEIPADSLVQGLMILVGGAFLLTPGFVTDAAGFLCLIPTTRRWLTDYLKRWIKHKIEQEEIEVYTYNGDDSIDDGL